MPQYVARSSSSRLKQQQTSVYTGLPQAAYCNTRTNDCDEIPLAIPIGVEQRT